jgi:hypothetical protein
MVSSHWGPDLHLGDHIIVIGVPGSGKTTHTRKLVARAPRVIYFDPAGDFEGVPGATVIDVEHWPVARFFREHYFRLVVRAERSPARNVEDEFVYVSERAREIGTLVLVADEVGDYNRGPAADALKRLHRNGHKRGLVTVLVSQRAVDIPLGCRATATRVESFLQDSEEDLRTMREMFDPSEPEFSSKVRAWKPGTPPVRWQRRRLYG